MMVRLGLVWACATLVVFAACGPVTMSSQTPTQEPDLGDCPMDMAAAEALALRAVPGAQLQRSETLSVSALDGAVVDTEAVADANTVTVFRVVLQTSGGAEVVVDRFASDCSLAAALGNEAPFDYQFMPGEGLVQLSEASLVAVNFRPGELQSWRLHVREDLGSIWVYAFVLGPMQDALSVVINAATAEVLDL